MELFVFLVVALALYFGADWGLRRYEASLGRQLEHRTIVFFFLLLILALAAFELIERFVPR